MALKMSVRLTPCGRKCYPIANRKGLLTATRHSTVLVLLAATAHAQDDSREFFETKVRPLLAARCYGCHGLSKVGGLRVDSRGGLLSGGKSGPAIVPGKPEQSLLIRAVTHADPKLKMPLSGAKLADREIADLSTWIEAGAPWPDAPP